MFAVVMVVVTAAALRTLPVKNGGSEEVLVIADNLSVNQSSVHLLLTCRRTLQRSSSSFSSC